jgi:tRNA dimethylallyltransferase
MIEAGLVEEVRSLVERGYSPDLPAMSGLGYGQIGRYLRGEISLEETIGRIKYDTHRFVRHQYNWFRLNDERIHWFDALSEPYQAIRTWVVSFLNQRQ